MTNNETQNPIRCVLCQGGLCLTSGDLHNFKDHLEKAHNAVFDLDFLVSIAFLETAERERIVETVYPRVKKYFQTLRADPLSGQLSLEKRLLEDLEENSGQQQPGSKRRKVKGSKYVSLTEQEQQQEEEEERKDTNQPEMEVETISDKAGEEVEVLEEEKSPESRCDICEKPMLKKSIRKHKQRVHQLYDNPRSSLFSINETVTEDVTAQVGDDSITDSSSLDLQGDLEVEEKSKYAGGSVTCQICFKLMSKKNLRRHISTVHNGDMADRDHKEHRCKICYARFSELNRLRDHVKNLHDIDYDNLESCEAEDEVQLDDSTIDKVGETGGTGKDYQCDQCEASYHVKDSLRRHKRKKH